MRHGAVAGPCKAKPGRSAPPENAVQDAIQQGISVGNIKARSLHLADKRGLWFPLLGAQCPADPPLLPTAPPPPLREGKPGHLQAAPPWDRPLQHGLKARWFHHTARAKKPRGGGLYRCARQKVIGLLWNQIGMGPYQRPPPEQILPLGTGHRITFWNQTANNAR